MQQKFTKWQVYKQVLLPAGLMAGLIIAGTLGFIIIEHYGLLDAVYMTVITIATVGFHEVRELSTAGRIFTILLILTSLGLVTYYITLLTHLFIDGSWLKQFKQYKKHKLIATMENHVIVCGYGRNGKKATETLFENKVEFVVIEKDFEKMNADELPDYHFIDGDGTKDEILIEAGINKAKALITTLPDDAANVFVVLSARQLNKNITIISRAGDDSSVKKLKIAGANNVIMPDKLGGTQMASLVLIPDVHEFISMLSLQHNDEFMITEIVVDKNFNLGELDIWKTTGCTVLGVKQGDGKYYKNPTADYNIKHNERIIVMGSKLQVDTLKTKTK